MVGSNELPIVLLLSNDLLQPAQAWPHQRQNLRTDVREDRQAVPNESFAVVYDNHTVFMKVFTCQN